MNEIWCSIIIPTLYQRPLVLEYLPSEDELRRMGIELIVVWDRWGWRSPSRSLNVGAAVARGEV